MSASGVRGVIFVHSCPRALISHVEWAVQRHVERTYPYEWSDQPIQAGMSRCEITWFGRSGSAANLVSDLRGFPNLRFEVTEDRADGQGERFCFTPTLGVFRAATGATGDLMVSESRLRAALDAADLEVAVRGLLGEAWDHELEPFRLAGDGDVRWLTRVG